MFPVYLFIFLLGLIVGSFLNVVIYRYNTGRSVSTGRSQCFACSHTLSWYELVPVFSFLAQGGRCRACQSAISWQYPAVELANGVLFVALFQHFLGVSLGKPLFLLSAVIFSLLLVITVYDLRHKIIPDGLVYAFIIFALIFSNWPFTQIVPTIFFQHLVSGLVLFLFFFFLWWVSSGRWMGLGDAKLALGVGFLLGWPGALSAIIFAFWSGALFGVLLILLKATKINLKSELPFAPFIVLGLLLNFFFNLNVLTVFNFF
ncbi:MAG: prepilin peptidase [Patescibacteria group bacterium]